jgi:hypothetical protein
MTVFCLKIAAKVRSLTNYCGGAPRRDEEGDLHTEEWIKSLTRFNQSEMLKTRLSVAVRYEHVLDTPRARLFFSMDVIILAERTGPGVQACRRMAMGRVRGTGSRARVAQRAKQGLARAQHAALGYRTALSCC